MAAEVDSRLWDCGVDDVALMSLVFDDGMVASVDPSWSVPAGNPWDYDFYLRVVGSRGSLAISDLAESVKLVSSHTGGGLRLVPFGDDVDAALIEAFVASVRAGRCSARAPTANPVCGPWRSPLPAMPLPMSRAAMSLPVQTTALD